MTIDGLGRITPEQLDLLSISGMVTDEYGVCDEPSPEEIAEAKALGHKALVANTGQDFGHDIDAWFNYLLSIRPYSGIDHPYGFGIMVSILREKGWSIAYPDQAGLEALDRQYYENLDNERGVFQTKASDKGLILCAFCNTRFKRADYDEKTQRHRLCHSKIELM